jgi:ubiquitin-conjugating enzyme E2 T
MQRSLRMQKEFKLLTNEPIPNISIYNNDANMTLFTAQIFGFKDSPYENGLFELEISIPERYPFEPPNVKFLTPIYHPNIDDVGRICLDLLKMAPDGNWKPALNLGTLLSSIQILITNPNLDDPLKPDIAEIYKSDYENFKRIAREFTDNHARKSIGKKSINKLDENNNNFN